jgi:hypothetical protein
LQHQFRRSRFLRVTLNNEVAEERCHKKLGGSAQTCRDRSHARPHEWLQFCGSISRDIGTVKPAPSTAERYGVICILILTV